MDSRFTFNKGERLTSQKIIGDLVQQGASVRAGCMKLIWLETELSVSYHVQVCIAVPKRRIPKAVDRILIKRRMRAAYRLCKAHLYAFLSERNQQAAIMVIFSGDTNTTYQKIDGDLQLAINKMISNLENNQ